MSATEDGANGASSVRVLVIGGGVAGLSAAKAVSEMGASVLLVEREAMLGGRVRGSATVFPLGARGAEVVAQMEESLKLEGKAEVMLESRLSFVHPVNGGFEVEVETSSRRRGGCILRKAYLANAIVLATGLEAIDPSAIPELGYPNLRDVVTAEGFEALMASRTLLRPSDGSPIKSLAFVQCVGSRVESRGVPYCSSVCCMNAIKSALAAKELDPDLEVYVLYIDVRTHGKGYEELYKNARQKGVRFIRGQPSMVAPVPGTQRPMVRGENTLLKELYDLPVDLVVLSVGLRQRHDNAELFQMLGVRCLPDGLVWTPAQDSVATSAEGVFVAGCVEAPKDVRDSMSQGAAAAMAALAHARGKAAGR